MSTARYEKTGVGSVEVDFDGLARLLAGDEPGGEEAARRLVERVTIITRALAVLLPHLDRAIAEIKRERGEYETVLHIPKRTPEDEERLVEEFREVVETWRNENESADELAAAARLSVDRGPSGGAFGGGG